MAVLVNATISLTCSNASSFKPGDPEKNPPSPNPCCVHPGGRAEQARGALSRSPARPSTENPRTNIFENLFPEGMRRRGTP